MMRRLILCLICGAALFCAGMWRLSDGFSISKMTGPLPYEPRWEVSSPSLREIRSLLSQPYYYIGKGSQCYVFESEDKKNILKFFRLSRFRLPAFQEALPLPPFLAEIQNKRREEKQRGQEELFASCTLAFNELKQECGLLYLHLNKTTHLFQELTLYDTLKRRFTLSADRCAFLIQRKGEQLYPYLDRMLKEGKREEVKKAIGNLNQLLDRRVAKEVDDLDPEIYKNAGFSGGRALFLDVGQFRKRRVVENRERTLRKLLVWLEEKDPELAKDIRSATGRSHSHDGDKRPA